MLLSKNKTVNLGKIRELVAQYINSEGCSCCEGDDHDAHEAALGEFLEVKKFDDRSGYDWRLYLPAKKK